MHELVRVNLVIPVVVQQGVVEIMHSMLTQQNVLPRHFHCRTMVDSRLWPMGARYPWGPTSSLELQHCQGLFSTTRPKSLRSGAAGVHALHFKACRSGNLSVCVSGATLGFGAKIQAIRHPCWSYRTSSSMELQRGVVK